MLSSKITKKSKIFIINKIFKTYKNNDEIKKITRKSILWDELDDLVNCIYLETKIWKRKNVLHSLRKSSIWNTIKRCVGYINAPKVLGNVCNLLENKEMINIKIPSIRYMLEILFVQWYFLKLKLKIFTYDDLIEEEYLLPLLNKMYWLLLYDRLIISNSRLNFCVSTCFNRMPLPYYTLFSRNI